ncbi:hypothetical protein JTB14_033568 [Gonioctena quinquepunctata]|nr:hypothetical protein JTB14_033568 [Gonioctena quinquepunctata]
MVNSRTKRILQLAQNINDDINILIPNPYIDSVIESEEETLNPPAPKAHFVAENRYEEIEDENTHFTDLKNFEMIENGIETENSEHSENEVQEEIQDETDRIDDTFDNNQHINLVKNADKKNKKSRKKSEMKKSTPGSTNLLLMSLMITFHHQVRFRLH